MRLVISSKVGDRVVDAALVDIGSGAEQFAAHRSIDEGLNGTGAWSVSHVATGFRLASGGTAAEALGNAADIWRSKTAGEHARAFAHAHEIRAGRRNSALEWVMP